MMFKGCKVYAQVDEGGNLLTHNGLVEIKYQLDQDRKYLARASSVKEIDETFLDKIKKERKKEKEVIKKKLPPPSLKKNHDDYIKVFTDGACEGNPGPAGIGIILQYRNHQKEISRYIGQGTNNIAELTAIKFALREIKSSDVPIYLYIDSDYCYKILSGSWKPKKNQKLIEEIKKEMVRFSCLNIIKVEAHKGIEGNERADCLARAAIKKKEKNVTVNDGNF